MAKKRYSRMRTFFKIMEKYFHKMKIIKKLKCEKKIYVIFMRVWNIMFLKENSNNENAIK